MKIYSICHLIMALWLFEYLFYLVFTRRDDWHERSCEKYQLLEMFDISTSHKRRPSCMLIIFSSAKDFWVVQKRVADIIKGRLLAGHALHNDLKVDILVDCCFLFD